MLPLKTWRYSCERYCIVKRFSFACVLCYSFVGIKWIDEILRLRDKRPSWPLNRNIICNSLIVTLGLVKSQSRDPMVDAWKMMTFFFFPIEIEQFSNIFHLHLHAPGTRYLPFPITARHWLYLFLLRYGWLYNEKYINDENRNSNQFPALRFQECKLSL